jgi:hypothetical protein
MRHRWTILYTLVFVGGVASAQTAGNRLTSPQEVLQNFWKVETEGSRLTPDGWYRATEFFLGRPIPPPQEKVISVVPNDCSLGTTSVTTDKAELYLYCSDFKNLNSKLQLGKPPNNPPNGAPVVPGMWIVYNLVLSDEHWELGPGGEPHQVKNVSEWKIQGFPVGYIINRQAAIRYVTEMRDESADATIKQNADKTIAILKNLH